MKKILFVADPVSRIRPATDTTLMLVRAAQELNLEAYWCVGEDLELRETELLVHAAKVAPLQEGDLPQLAAPGRLPVQSFEGVWIRKDPPFDSSYQRVCWLLGLEEGRVRFVNRPSLLLRYHEKLIPFEAVHGGFLRAEDLVPTQIGDRESGKKYVEQHAWKTWIEKPFLGFAGKGVRLMTKDSAVDPKETWDHLVQPFLPGVQTAGDRRVFLLQGNYRGDFVRIPKAGGILSNLAQGGTAKQVPLSETEQDRIERLGKFLKKAGIDFAGVDLLDGRVSEVNITSPTGFPMFRKMTGIDLATDVIQLGLR